MTYAIGPSASSKGLPQSDFLKPETQVMNFTGDPALYQVTRGTGEHSNVITVTRIGGALP